MTHNDRPVDWWPIRGPTPPNRCYREAWVTVLAAVAVGYAALGAVCLLVWGIG
jgi:hypothetical protein